MPSIQYLGDQIREILVSDSELVPDSCGTFAYSSSSWIGRFWTFIWALSRIIDWSGQWREHALQNSIDQMNFIWSQEVEKLKRNAELFDSNLREGQSTLHEWHYSVGRVFQEYGFGLLDVKLRKVGQFILGCSCKENVELLEKAEEDFSTIRVQRLVKQPIPESVLQKVADGQGITEEEQESYLSFIKRLLKFSMHSNPSKRLSIGELHRCMKTLVSHGEANDEPTVVRRLSKLYFLINDAFQNEGCRLFEEKDNDYLKRLDQIGYQHIQEVSQVMIGAEIIGSKNRDAERHRVFEKRDDPSQVIVFGALNQTQILIEMQTASERDYGLPTANLHGVSLDGFALCERLSRDTTETYLWDEDTNNSTFQKRFQSLLVMVAHMCKYNYTPLGFHSKMLRFDANDQITFLRYSPQGPFHFDRLTQVVFEALAHKVSLHQEVVTESGLTDHKDAAFYRRFMFLAMMDEREELQRLQEGMACSEVPFKEEMLAKAERLKREAENIIWACKHQILRDYEVDSENTLEKVLKIKVADSLKYRAIPDSLLIKAEDLIKKVLTFLPPLLKEPLFNNAFQSVVSKARELLFERNWRGERQEFLLLIEKWCYETGIYAEVQMTRVKYALPGALFVQTSIPQHLRDSLPFIQEPQRRHLLL